MAEEIEPQIIDPVTSSSDKSARYRAKNREKRRLQSAEWWERNGAAYRAANRERLRASQAKWRETNREKARSRVSEYQRLNPEKRRASEIKYRKAYPDRRKASVEKYRNKPENRERERATRAVWAQANLAKLAAKSAVRRSLKIRATPAWANCDAIEAIYAEARRLTMETGVEHHVDHIVPLKSKYVCGLHCEANLQILPCTENISKGNRTWPDMWK